MLCTFRKNLVQVWNNQMSYVLHLFPTLTFTFTNLIMKCQSYLFNAVLLISDTLVSLYIAYYRK